MIRSKRPAYEPAAAGDPASRSRVEQLEIVEVDRRALALGRGVRVGEAAEELVEEHEDRARAGVAAAGGEDLEGGEVAPARVVLQLGHRARGVRRRLERERRGGLLGRQRGEHRAARLDRRAGAFDRHEPARAAQRRPEGFGGGVELGPRRAEVGRRRHRQHRARLAAAAQRVVRVADHLGQAVGHVGRGEVERVGAGRPVGEVGEEGGERGARRPRGAGRGPRARRGRRRPDRARRPRRARAGPGRRSRGRS